MKLLKFALLLCLSMMFATSHAQMAVKKSDAGRAANLSGDKKFELSIGYNDYIVSQPGDDSHWASSSFGGRVRIKELDCSLPLSLESGLFLRRRLLQLYGNVLFRCACESCLQNPDIFRFFCYSIRGTLGKSEYLGRNGAEERQEDRPLQ